MIRIDAEQLTHVSMRGERRGCTTWILKSALKDPKDLILVFANGTIAKSAEDTYLNMIENMNFISKFLIKRKPKPLFKSVHDAFGGVRGIVVFDNSCFLRS